MVRWASTGLLVGSMQLAGLTVANIAHADPDSSPTGHWCPGQALLMSGYPPHPKVWKMDTCHDWYGIFNQDYGTWTIVEGTPPYV